jgi:hypothetical protein
LQCLVDQGAVSWVQVLPETLIGDHRIAQVTVLGQAQVALHFVHGLGPEVRNRIFCSVHHACGQRPTRFAEGQRHRPGAQCTHLSGNHLRGLHPHAQTGEVLWLQQRPVGAHLFETIVKKAQPHQALTLKPPEQALPQRAQGNAPHGSEVVKQERQVKQLKFRQTDATKFGQ